MLNVPELDGDDPKEVYAFVGLALYGANLLEASLINLAVVLQLDRVGAITREIFDELFEHFDKRTLGQLLKATRTLTRIPGETDEALASALELRNHLVHEFFRSHADDFADARGRRLMLEELRAMLFYLRAADALITPVYTALWTKYGVDEEFMERELREMQRETKERFDKL